MKQNTARRTTDGASANKSATVTPLPPRKRLRRGEADARIPEILDAALIAFAEKGFAATRMDDIAARVGVSKPIIYRHFATKNDLFQALMTRDFLRPYEEAQKVMSVYNGPLRPLLATFMGLIKSDLPTTKTICSIKILASAPVNNEGNTVVIDEGMGAANQVLAKLFERAMARGEMRKCDSENAVKHLFAPMWHCAFRILLLGEKQWTDWDMARYMDESFEAFCRAYDIA